MKFDFWEDHREEELVTEDGCVMDDLQMERQ